MCVTQEKGRERDKEVRKWSIRKYCYRRMFTLDFSRNAVTIPGTYGTYANSARRFRNILTSTQDELQNNGTPAVDQRFVVRP